MSLQKSSCQSDETEKLLTCKLWSKSECRLWTANLFIGTCTLYASRVALPICATAIAHEYAWNKSDSGIVLSCFFWGYAFTQIIAGGIGDRVGGEKVLRTTTLIWILLTFFTPQLFDLSFRTRFPFFFVIIIRIFTGVGQGFHVPCVASITSRHLSTSDKGRVFGLCLAGSHLGTALAGAVGSLLLEAVGWRALFHFVGFVSLLWWLVFRQMTTMFTHSYRPCMKHKGSDIFPESGELKITLEKTTTLPNAAVQEASSKVPWGILLQHSAFWAAATAQYCGSNAYYTMFSWMPSYFADNFPTAKSFLYNVVPSLAIVCTSFAAPFLGNKLLIRVRSVTIVRRVMEGTSLAGIAICLLCIVWSDNFASALILVTLAMAARGIHHAGVSVNPCDFAPCHTGTVFGVFNTFSSVTGFIGVYIAGYILQETNNDWSLVFIFNSLQCVLGILVYSMFGTGNRII